jgi:hypothetical protein
MHARLPILFSRRSGSFVCPSSAVLARWPIDERRAGCGSGPAEARRTCAASNVASVRTSAPAACLNNNNTPQNVYGCTFVLYVCSCIDVASVPLRLMLRACCPLIDAASCSASPRALGLLLAHRCSFVFRFASRFAPAARP